MRGCALGCLVAIVATVAFVVVTSRTVVRPFEAAIEERTRLEERFGDQGAYTPAADGAVAPERVEAFLTVRDRLVEPCARFAELTEEFRRMESLGEDGEPTKVEAMRQALSTTQAAFRMAPMMGEYFSARNRALLDAGMGLGEYTYIYVAAYGHHFAEGPAEDPLFGGDPLNRRVRGHLLGMLRGQLESLAEDDPLAGVLRAEIAAMEADDDRRPFADGLPEPVASSLAPHREALDAVFCVETSGIDLLRNKERRFGIEAE